MVVEAVSNEKGIAKEIIFEAIEAALASATKKRRREDIEVRVAIDQETGDYETFRQWEVVEDSPAPLEFPTRQIFLADAQEKQPGLEVGGFIEEPEESVEFGRIAAQTAKQIIIQKVRDAERKQVHDAYIGRVGEMVIGFVKKVEKGNVILDLGNNAEGFIPREEMIPREAARPRDQLRAYLREVRSDTRGPQLLLSRTAPELLVELFKIEVPEINEGLIEIISGARDPGSRAKIAVKAVDSRIDPIGACVGMRGSRVQAVSNALGGERVDIILWDENPAQFVINAMAPAEVASMLVDEEAHSMDVAVSEENLSQAIGRGGQNVKLASELTQWEINVMSEEQAQNKTEEETQKLQKMFMEQLDVDEEIAVILVQEGFSSIEEVAYVPDNELLEIEEFDETLIKELRERAKDIIVTRGLIDEERFADAEPDADLLEMEGMDEALAHELAGRGVVTMEDLAELSIDELVEIGEMDKERAASLIMTARAPWFTTEDNGAPENANA